MSLQLQQALLKRQPAGKPAQRTIMRNDPMTGDDDGDRIRAQGHPHGPRILLSADSNGDPLIGPHAAIGNGGDRFPHFSLNVVPPDQSIGERKLTPRTGQIGQELFVASSTMAPRRIILAPVGLRA